MKKKRMIMIVAMVLVLVWREDVFAVESGTTQVSLQADWLQEGDYQYSVEEDETVTLRNYIGTESVIVTPKEVGGKEVTRIGDSCFLRKTDLRAVQISEGIVEIGESAFAEDGQYSDTTAGFISIVMPKTLKKVGKSAFQGTRITQIYFYDGLESIGDNAFMYCSSLSKIRIPDSVEKVGQFLFLGAGKPYEESQDSAMKIFGGKIAEELAKDNQRAEYGGEEMQEISIQYWLEKKENETKEEVIGQKYFDKKEIGILSISTIVSTVTVFLQPLLIKQITDIGILEKNMPQIVNGVAGLFVCVLVYLMIEVVQAKTFAEIHNSFYKNLYCNVFRKLLHLKKHYFQMKNSMEIVQMLQCDVSQVASMTDRYVVMSFSYVFRVISGLAGLMLLSPELFMLQDR